MVSLRLPWAECSIGLSGRPCKNHSGHIYARGREAMLEPMHSIVANCSVVDACVQVRAESPMEHSAQGKRSDTLGIPMLEQSRPERAKALQCALDFYRT